MARVLAAILALIGVQYSTIGVSVLVNLPDVTQAWIRASGDPDSTWITACS